MFGFLKCRKLEKAAFVLKTTTKNANESMKSQLSLNPSLSCGCRATN